MNSQGTGAAGGKQGGQGSKDTPLSNATYNMVQALHNIVDALWHYDAYIEQDKDSDAQEMWKRFKQEDMRKAMELKNHLSRRLQHETGPEGKAGAGPNEGGVGK